MPKTDIKPIVKWVGGKSQIIDKIMEYFPTSINNYHELFLGGGSVLFALLNNIENGKITVQGTINAYDINETLIYMYKNIQSHPQNVLDECYKLIEKYNNITDGEVNRKPKNINEALTSKESYYYYIRSQFNKLKQNDKNKPLGSAYFIFLNKTCFRGLYREGPNGYNVPYGNYKNPEIINEEHIMKISDMIKNVNFIHCSFEEAFNHINEDDFIYLDPPYAPETNKSFVNYTANGFTLEQHELLFTECKKYNFVLSNADVTMVKEHFSDFNIDIIKCKRAINSKNPGATTNEVIIY